MIETQEPGVRIIDKTGPLANPADRDHCIQYMVAVPLIFGRLTAADYEDDDRRRPAHRRPAREDGSAARTPRSRKDYYERDKRYIGNAVQVFFNDGSPKLEICASTSRSATASAAPKACRCWCRSSRLRWPRTFRAKQTEAIKALFARQDLDAVPVNEFMAALVANQSRQ